MVILEALACSVPVVAFNCPTGPNDVIANKNNGLLIENQNIEALITGMNRMLDDIDLHRLCKNNALKSVQKYSIDVIGQQWLKLINNFNTK